MVDLEIVPRNLFSWSFDIMRNDMTVAQILHTLSLKESATLNLSGATYQAYREHFMGGDYLLEEDGQPIARAQKQGLFVNSFQIKYPDGTAILKKESAFGRSFLLIEGEREAGFIRPVGPFSRKADVSLPDEMPLPVQIFVIWLVLVTWKRQSDSSHAVTAHTF